MPAVPDHQGGRPRTRKTPEGRTRAPPTNKKKKGGPFPFASPFPPSSNPPNPPPPPPPPPPSQKFKPQTPTPTHQPPTPPLDDAQASLVPDRSARWDSNGIYEHDLPIRMLDQLRAHLEALADHPDNHVTLRDILRTLTGTPLSALVWRRLLIAGTNRPATHWDGCYAPLRGTTRSSPAQRRRAFAGVFARAIHPTLESADRERIEPSSGALRNGNDGTPQHDPASGIASAGGTLG